jgi:hypothetical protein
MNEAVKRPPVDQIRLSAFHEAGHAVMAHYGGAWFEDEGVWIDGEGLGMCEVFNESPLNHPHVRVWFALAGPAAEYIDSGMYDDIPAELLDLIEFDTYKEMDPFEASQLMFNEYCYMCDLDDNAPRPDECKVWSNLGHAFKVKQPGLSTSQRENSEALPGMCRQVVEILKANWEYVEIVAHELLENGQVDDERLGELLQDMKQTPVVDW